MGGSHSAGTRQRTSCVLYNAARDWVKGRKSSFHLLGAVKMSLQIKTYKMNYFLFSATTFETNFYSKRIWAVSIYFRGYDVIEIGSLAFSSECHALLISPSVLSRVYQHQHRMLNQRTKKVDKQDRGPSFHK